jgi:hypothetical protein
LEDEEEVRDELTFDNHLQELTSAILGDDAFQNQKDYLKNTPKPERWLLSNGLIAEKHQLLLTLNAYVSQWEWQINPHNNEITVDPSFLLCGNKKWMELVLIICLWITIGGALCPLA